MLRWDHLLKLAEIVSSCLSLTKLELKNNMLQSEWLENFVTALNLNPRGCTVSIEEHWIGTDDALRLLCRFLQLSQPIHTIRIDHTTLQLVLMDNTGMSQISVATNRLSVEGAELLFSLLPSLPNLTSLSVGIKDSTVCLTEELLRIILMSTSIQCLKSHRRGAVHGRTHTCL